MAKAMKGTSKKARSQLSEVMHQFRKNKGYYYIYSCFCRFPS